MVMVMHIKSENFFDKINFFKPLLVNNNNYYRQIFFYLAIYFSLIVEDADDSNSLDEYLTAFLQYAYYTDEVCFSLDAGLQRFFGLVAYYVLLQKFFTITRPNGPVYCLAPSSTTKNALPVTPKIIRYLTISFYDLKQYFTSSLMFAHVNKNS